MLKIWSVRTSAGAGRDIRQWKPRVRGRWQNYYYHHQCHLEPTPVEEEQLETLQLLEETQPSQTAFLPLPLLPITSCSESDESFYLEDPFCGATLVSSTSSSYTTPSSIASSTSLSSSSSSSSSSSGIRPENAFDAFSVNSQASHLKNPMVDPDAGSPRAMLPKRDSISNQGNQQSTEQSQRVEDEQFVYNHSNLVTPETQECCSNKTESASHDDFTQNHLEQLVERSNIYAEFQGFGKEFSAQECWTMIESAIREDAIRRCRPSSRKRRQYLPIWALHSWNDNDTKRLFRAIQLELELGLNVDREGVINRIMKVSFPGERDRELKIEDGWNLLVDFLLSDQCPLGYAEFLILVNNVIANGKTTARGEELLDVVETLDDLCSNNVFWEGEERELILDSLFVIAQSQRQRKQRNSAPTARGILRELKLIRSEMNNVAVWRSRQQMGGKEEENGQRSKEKETARQHGGRYLVPGAKETTNKYHHGTIRHSSEQTRWPTTDAVGRRRPPLGSLNGNQISQRTGRKES